MKLKIVVIIGTVLCVLFGMSCGPEAETGAVFSRYSAHPCAAPSPVDTVSPVKAGTKFLMGKFNPTRHPDFVLLEPPYAARPGMYLQKEAYTAFQKMWQAAKTEGINLSILSATRTFDYQKGIWGKKWSKYAAQFPEPKARALKILEYSSMPGSSRHHWGTDIDLNNLNDAAFTSGGAHEKAYIWLQKHASEYGFFQPYSPKGQNRPNGYNEEKWHWSYRPISEVLLQEYEQTIKDAMFADFQGAETAPQIEIVKNYVSGIAKTQ